MILSQYIIRKIVFVFKDEQQVTIITHTFRNECRSFFSIFFFWVSFPYIKNNKKDQMFTDQKKKWRIRRYRYNSTFIFARKNN